MLYRKLLISINKLEIECVCNCVKETKVQNFNKHAFRIHPRLTYKIKTIPFFKDFFTRYHVLKNPFWPLYLPFLSLEKKTIRQWYYLNEFVLWSTRISSTREHFKEYFFFHQIQSYLFTNFKQMPYLDLVIIN